MCHCARANFDRISFLLYSLNNNGSKVCKPQFWNIGSMTANLKKKTKLFLIFFDSMFWVLPAFQNYQFFLLVNNLNETRSSFIVCWLNICGGLEKRFMWWSVCCSWIISHDIFHQSDLCLIQISGECHRFWRGINFTVETQYGLYRGRWMNQENVFASAMKCCAQLFTQR